MKNENKKEQKSGKYGWQTKTKNAHTQTNIYIFLHIPDNK